MSTWEDILNRYSPRATSYYNHPLNREWVEPSTLPRYLRARSSRESLAERYHREYMQIPQPETHSVVFSSDYFELQARIEEDIKAKWFHLYLMHSFDVPFNRRDFRDHPAVTVEYNEFNKLQMRGIYPEMMVDIAAEFNRCMSAIPEDFEEGGVLDINRFSVPPIRHVNLQVHIDQARLGEDITVSRPVNITRHNDVIPGLLKLDDKD
ncbi:MAG: hypothetical protein J6S85_14820 [Methanobrevibacter sp.]|nr:hypothetical protein [Methanobrevibacter sp.]